MESFQFFILVLQDSYAQTSVSTVRDRLKTPQCLCLTVKVRELPSSISVYLCGRPSVSSMAISSHTRIFAWQGEVVSPADNPYSWDSCLGNLAW